MLLRVMMGKLTYSTLDEHYTKSIFFLAVKFFVELSRAYIIDELLFSCKFVLLLIFYILAFSAFFSDFIKGVPYWSSCLS